MKFYNTCIVHVQEPVVKIFIILFLWGFFSVDCYGKLFTGTCILQWLVKKAIETREEMGDFIRAFSISQFSKTHKTPEVRYMYLFD